VTQSKTPALRVMNPGQVFPMVVGTEAEGAMVGTEAEGAMEGVAQMVQL